MAFSTVTNHKRESEIIANVCITCKAELVVNVLGVLNRLADRIQHSDLGGTLAFLVLMSLDNDQGVYAFRTFRSWKAKADQESNRAALSFWQGSKDHNLRRESQVYCQNSTRDGFTMESQKFRAAFSSLPEVRSAQVDASNLTN